jgi:hypothetical protein
MSQDKLDSIRRGWEHWSATGEVRGHTDLVWDVSKLGPDEASNPWRCLGLD